MCFPKQNFSQKESRDHVVAKPRGLLKPDSSSHSVSRLPRVDCFASDSNLESDPMRAGQGKQRPNQSGEVKRQIGGSLESEREPIGEVIDDYPSLGYSGDRWVGESDDDSFKERDEDEKLDDVEFSSKYDKLKYRMRVVGEVRSYKEGDSISEWLEYMRIIVQYLEFSDEEIKVFVYGHIDS